MNPISWSCYTDLLGKHGPLPSRKHYVNHPPTLQQPSPQLPKYASAHTSHPPQLQISHWRCLNQGTNVILRPVNAKALKTGNIETLSKETIVMKLALTVLLPRKPKMRNLLTSLCHPRSG